MSVTNFPQQIVSGAIGSGQLAQPAGFYGTTVEAVSGVRAVHFTQSGLVRIAMASVSGRMPAIGIVTDNVASGISALIKPHGTYQATSGIFNFSGRVGQAVLVGRSGQINQISGWFGSAGILSGDFTQRVGVAYNTGAIYFNILPFHTSGNPTGWNDHL